MTGQIAMPWGEPTERESDFWPTPAPATLALLAVCPPPERSMIGEPAGGSGAIVRVLVGMGRTVSASDLRPECGPDCIDAGAIHFEQRDWIADPHNRWESIITNPPFSVAQEFTRACIAAEPCYLALLLRLNVLGSNPWAPLWLEHPPTGIYPLRHRPSFSGDGKTDACNYAWFTFIAGERPCNIRPI
ncbi:MAG: hypothetical protein V1755_05635 [Chloroflexota bacterium]